MRTRGFADAAENTGDGDADAGKSDETDEELGVGRAWSRSGENRWTEKGK